VVQSKQQQKLQALVNAGRLESIPFDAGIFTEQTNSCSLFRSDAIFLIEKDSVQGAFSVAYTYMRKSATLLLAVRQVRPTARGGHRVISDVLAFEPQLPKQLVIDYEKLREKRNKVEYPSAFVEDVDIALINRCIAIGDLLLAAARSASS
jgi:hypothetical protein